MAEDYGHQGTQTQRPQWKKLIEGYEKYQELKDKKTRKLAKLSKKPKDDDDEGGSKVDRIREELPSMTYLILPLMRGPFSGGKGRRLSID
jgi:hypothetical protein